MHLQLVRALAVAAGFVVASCASPPGLAPVIGAAIALKDEDRAPLQAGAESAWVVWHGGDGPKAKPKAHAEHVEIPVSAPDVVSSPPDIPPPDVPPPPKTFTVPTGGSAGQGTSAPPAVSAHDLAIPSRDALRARLEAHGAQTGDIQISLAWNTVDDVDLHVTAPCGQELYYSHKSGCGGTLDVDMNVGADNAKPEAVENVFWPASAAPTGHYVVKVNLYAQRDNRQEELPFLVRIRKGADTIWKTGKARKAQKGTVAEFDWP